MPIIPLNKSPFSVPTPENNFIVRADGATSGTTPLIKPKANIVPLISKAASSTPADLGRKIPLLGTIQKKLKPLFDFVTPKSQEEAVSQGQVKTPGGVVIDVPVLASAKIGKSLLSRLFKSKTTGEALEALVKRNVPKDIADVYAPIFSKAKTIDEVKKAATGLEKLLRSVGVDVLDDAPSAKSTIDKLVASLKEAEPLRSKQESLYSAERAKRAGRVAAIGKKVSGERGFQAQLGQLKGELPKVEFETIRKNFSQGEIDSLFNAIEKTDTLLPFEKITAKTGLAKIFKAEGGAVPTKSEIELLRETFPKEFIDAVLDKRPFSKKFFEGVAEVFNIPRTLMATFDFSAPLRQGIFLVGRPKRFASAFKDMFRYAFNPKAYEGLLENIKTRPSYKFMKGSQLALTDVASSKLTKREEAFMSSLPERIPGIGRVVRASNRAYSGFLNKLRADTFDDLLQKTDNLGIEKTDKVLRDISKFVNSATGRGDLGSLNKAAVPLNSIFFSPRLIASRINLLNPYFYVTLSPAVRREALRSLLTFGAAAGTILGVGKMAGAEVETDPRNADFLKMKTGNTRYDVLGGFQQYVRLASQLISGKVVSSTTGRTITLGEGYKPLTRKDIAQRFFEFKTSPIASFALALMSGRTALGEDVDLPTEVSRRFTPMVLQDLYELKEDKGLSGLFMWLPAPFGVGVQTYGKQEVVFGEDTFGRKTAQIRGVPDLGSKISETLFGQQPLGPSRTYNVQAYYEQLSSLPREEAAAVFDSIAEASPDLADKILDVVKEREKGITSHDLDLKSKGVASGDRARAIKKDLDKLKSPEEKAALWDEYSYKGIITPDVSDQVLILLEQDN